MHGTLVLIQKRKKNNQILKQDTCSVNSSSVSWTSRVKANSLRQITMQKQGFSNSV